MFVLTEFFARSSYRSVFLDVYVTFGLALAATVSFLAMLFLPSKEARFTKLFKLNVLAILFPLFILGVLVLFIASGIGPPS